MKKALDFKIWLLASMLALLAACGGGGGGGSTAAPPPVPPAPTLVSIAVTPANASVTLGATRQMTATATYSDGKSSDITTSATWSVAKGVSVVIGASSGVATGKAAGADTVTATVGTVAGSTGLSVIVPWASVEAGADHTLALKVDGTLFAWGENARGQLGDSTTSPTVPRVTQVYVADGIDTWKMVAAGGLHSVALRSDGSLWTWGDNSVAQLGIGSAGGFRSSPVRIDTGNDWVYVAAGKAHSFAINKAGQLYAWGLNTRGQLGIGAAPVAAPLPVRVGTFTNWTMVLAGDNHSVGLRADGTMYAWGDNAFGQVGNGDGGDDALCSLTTVVAPAVTTPTQIPRTWIAVAAGTNYTAAIRIDGTLWTWGLNNFGQLGIVGPSGTPLSCSATPLPVDTSTNWAKIATSANACATTAGDGDACVSNGNATSASHTLAIKTDGTLWAWGDNSFGQLGQGSSTATTFFKPAQVGNARTWVSVAAGSAHSFGVQSDGTLWGWGANNVGQQGNGSVNLNALVYAPTRVP
ncbi:MAG: hypothetical protein V4724_09650 [Pseudomonadota bacterium]